LKSFEPTPSRLERARREGDHPISRDAVAVAAFGGAFAALLLLLPFAHARLLDSMHVLSIDAAWPPLALVVVSVSACGSGAAVFATFAQARSVTFRPLTWRLGISSIVSAQAIQGVARATAALFIGGGLVAASIRPVPEAIRHVVEIAVAIGAAAALADIVMANRAWRRKLRMTFEELRRELREHDGDPLTRARRRRMRQQMLRGALRAVRKATFVVVNPTHIAVALRYVPSETSVPVILVRAADGGAQRVKTLAAEEGIPTIEDPPLARQLYELDALGPIPPELYLAIAQIIAMLQRG
jgi:flagellar biosynthesis protein FlhB